MTKKTTAPKKKPAPRKKVGPKFNLNRTDFVLDMKARRPATLVGFAGSIIDCPLAKHLSAKGARKVIVGKGAAYTTDRPNHAKLKLPKWALNLVAEFDKLDPGKRITARHVLDFMGEK